MDRKILSLFVVCGSLFVSTSHLAYASNSGAKSPSTKASGPSFISHFSTDKMEYNTSELILSAKGNVEIRQDNMVLKADTIEYNQAENKVHALGNVTILDDNGKVAFFDKLELKNGIKEAIVNKFKAQMIDNDVFMAAEERKPSEHMASHASSSSKKSFFDKFDKMITYLSPDFLTASNEQSNAENLANLAPAAGDNLATLDNKPVIGNVPLIEVPDAKTQAKPEPATTPAEPATPAQSVTAPPAPTVAASPPPIEEESKAEVKIADVPPPAPAITPLISSPKEAEDKKNEQKAIEEIVTKGEEIKKEAEEKIEKADNDIKEKIEENKAVEEKKEEKERKPAAKKTETVKSTKKDTEKKLITEESPSEPGEALSPKSRDLLGKLKTSMKPKKEETAASALKVDRSHNMQDLFKGNESEASSSQSDALGVKVDRKGQAVSIDYELEKAYNATVSGQTEAAMAAYQSVLDNAPNNTQALFGLATLYHRARQFDKARPLYGRLLAVDPDHRDGFNNFLVLLADEAPREALVELEKLEEKNPGFSTIPAQIAVIYQKLGNSDKAIDKMFRAVALSPENLTYRYNLAIMLDKQKNYDEASKLYRQLVEASDRGEKIPGNISNIQQRLTFISSNRP